MSEKMTTGELLEWASDLDPKGFDPRRMQPAVRALIAALDAPIEDSLRADLAAAKDEDEDIATLLRVSDSLLAAANARCAALEGVVGEMIFHSSRKDGECL